MNQVPDVYTADYISKESRSTLSEYSSGKWTPARPLSIGGLWIRIKLAFGVFTGRYDALDWEDIENELDHLR